MFQFPHEQAEISTKSLFSLVNTQARVQSDPSEVLSVLAELKLIINFRAESFQGLRTEQEDQCFRIAWSLYTSPDKKWH